MHELGKIVILSPTKGTYECSCGGRGSTNIAGHLASRTLVLKNLVTNHELHKVRKLIRAGVMENL